MSKNNVDDITGLAIWGAEFEDETILSAIMMADEKKKDGQTYRIKPKQVLLDFVRLFYDDRPKTAAQIKKFVATGEVPPPKLSKYMILRLKQLGRWEK